MAGTLILTVSGLRAIESIRAGDRVLATDPESGVTEEKAVVETYVRETGQLVHLRVGGKLISTTPNHPFWVKGRGFVCAGELQAGEELVNAAGEGCRIENIRPEIVERPERVYNFQVEGFHTYHVGSIGVLVHNADYGGEGGTISVREQLLDSVSNDKLKNCINEMYRPGATIGDGGLADAIRHELTTGELVGGKSHIMKALERVRNLENIIAKQNLDSTDFKIATELLNDLKSALELGGY